MEKKFTIPSAAIAVLALVVAGIGLFTGDTFVTNPVIERTVEKVENVGKSLTSERQFFTSGATLGGKKIATTTGVTLSSYTLTQSEIENVSVLAINPSAELTLNIGATSTYSSIPNIGDTAKMYLRNASTTAAATITLAAVNAEVDLQKTQSAGDLVLLGLDYMELTFVRQALSGNAQVAVMVNEMTEAD